MSTHLDELVRQHFELNRELTALLKMNDAQRLGPPATEAELAAVEREFGVQLPGDYRNFLRNHNGWFAFDGELDLLSTEQMREPRMRNQIDGIAYSLREAGLVSSERIFIIEGSPTGKEITFYDFSTSTSEITPELYSWDGEELDDYPDFTTFLQSSVDVMMDLVKEEKARFRKRKPKS
jgi:hypothetical protein